MPLTLSIAQPPPKKRPATISTRTSSIGRQPRDLLPLGRSARRLPPRPTTAASSRSASGSPDSTSSHLLSGSDRVHRLARGRPGRSLGVDRSLQDHHRRGLVDHRTALPALPPP